MATTTDMATESALKALAESGRSIVDHRSICFEERGVLSGSLKSVVGGKVSTSRVELIVADGPLGRVVVAQPFDGNTPLPGELHTIIAGALVDSATYDSSGFLGSNWHSGNDQLQTYLRSNAFGASDLPDDLKHGFTSIRLDWTVQIHAIATDRSWITCQLGGFSGAGAHASALGVVDQLAPAVAMSTSNGPTVSPYPARLDRLAELAFAGQLDALVEDGALPEQDIPCLDPALVGPALEAALSSRKGKRVLLAPLDDEKKLTNISHKVAVDVDHDKILAFIDTGLRASGNAGVAFTASTVYVNELGDRFVFNYDSIRSFRLDGSTVSIVGTDGTKTSIASNSEAAIIMDALKAATNRPG